MRNSGYTLVELVIVMCLLMLLIGITVGNRGTSKIGACSAVYTLHSVCNYMHMRARATNQTHILSFDIEHNTYCYNGMREQLPSGVVFGVLDRACGPPSSPVRPITHPITAENQCITFTPHGIIQPGAIYIKTTDNSCMYALSVSVAQASFVRMYEYRHGTWILLT
ncbi:MAG: hypothetical protein ACHQVS_03565 [Candidatus Babeliales bacterium]